MRRQLTSLLLLIPFVFYGQTYLFDTWNSNNGLAVSDVNDITQDKQGYLWLATEGGGVSRFDGKSFQNFTTNEGLPSDFVSCFSWIKDSVLAIGTEKGICFYNGISFLSPDSVYRNDEQRVVALEYLHDTLFIIYRHRIGYFKNGKVNDYKTSSFFKNQNIYSSSLLEDDLWISCDSGIVNISSLKTLEKGVVSNYFKCENFELVYREDKGELWVQDAGLPILIDTLKFRNGIRDALLWKKENLVFSSEKGIQVVNKDGETQVISFKEGLPIENVKCVFEDQFQNLWIGGYEGLSKWVNPSIENHSKLTGLEDEKIHAIYAQDNKVWFGTNSGIEMLDDEGYHSYEEISAGVVFKIFEDHFGMLWFATESGLISYYKNEFQFYGAEHGIDDYFVFDIIETVDEQLVVATSSSVYIQNDYGFESIFDKESFGASSLKIDHFNRVWFNPLQGGLAYWENNKVVFVDSLNDQPLSQFRITCFDIEMEDKLWLGTLESGILHWDGSTLEHWTESDGLFSEKVVGILNLDATQTWVLYEQGVQKLELINQNWESSSAFSTRQGFLGNNSNANAISWDQSNQKIWLGTQLGAVAIDVLKEAESQLAYTPELQQIDLYFEPTLWANEVDEPWSELPKNLKLDFDQNYLTFHFGAITSGSPNDLFYRYKLKGQDENWTLANDRFEAVYTNISHGNFEFLLEVSSSSSFKDAKRTSYSIVIVAPYYKTVWFWAIIIIALGGLAGWLVRLRINQINEKQKLKSALAESERKALRLQMNPHFIFNALDSISGFIFKNEPKQAVRYLNSFAKLMRLTLESSRKTMVPLVTEINLIKNYLMLEQVRFNDSFDFTIDIDDDIDEYLVMLPPMVIQPNLENAILHGLRYKKEHGNLKIHFAATDNELICEIEDDGVGRKYALEKKSAQKNGHKGLSSNITKERMSLLSKSMERRFTYEIIDLKNELGEAKGTKVVLTFPLIEDDGFDD